MCIPAFHLLAAFLLDKGPPNSVTDEVNNVKYWHSNNRQLICLNENHSNSLTSTADLFSQENEQYSIRISCQISHVFTDSKQDTKYTRFNLFGGHTYFGPIQWGSICQSCSSQESLTCTYWWTYIVRLPLFTVTWQTPVSNLIFEPHSWILQVHEHTPIFERNCLKRLLTGSKGTGDLYNKKL